MTVLRGSGVLVLQFLWLYDIVECLYDIVEPPFGRDRHPHSLRSLGLLGSANASQAPNGAFLALRARGLRRPPSIEASTQRLFP